MHFVNYINSIKLTSSELADSVENTSTKLSTHIQEKFDYKSNLTGLLLGNVQSGKTAQMLGSIAKFADEGFDLFILLSTDNIYLQQQTLLRAKSSLTSLNIIGEDDDLTFLTAKLSKPTLVILKKNTNILKKWRNLISSSGLASGRPVVIFDDEADAASLNTLVNKKSISQINNHLNSLKELFTGSIYIQVTATPQSVLLQSSISGWKPSFVEYFSPGSNYIGGDFIYSEPKSFCIKITNENELDDIKSGADFLPLGLRSALLTYLIICSEFSLKGKSNCNFLVHPSVRIADHESFATILGENLNSFLFEITDESTRASFLKELSNTWLDLQSSQPDISSLEDVKEKVLEILDQQNLSIIVLNSKTSVGVTYNIGFNILIGGNSLGRGVTLQNLQVVYYCRKSKTPQADTFWQHARVFGYDRVKGLLRVFTPPSLFELFKELNYSNKLLIQQIVSSGIEGIQLIYPKNINPTRKNVLDKDYLNVLVGGVNLFSTYPSDSSTSHLDSLLAEYDESEKHDITGKGFLEVLEAIGKDRINEWESTKFQNCTKALIEKRPTQKFTIIVRRDRNISKGTGTMLSPTDRKLGDSLPHNTILTLYRINGAIEKGWDGKDLWMPNIKFPEGVCFYDTIG